MFYFFKISVVLAILMLSALSILTLSDVFIHHNTFHFQVMTIIVAALFALIALVGVNFYRDFTKIHHYIISEKQAAGLYFPLQKLLFLFGLAASIICLIAGIAADGMFERMMSGTTLFG